MAASGIWAPIALRAFRHALKKTSGLIRARITDISRPLNRELQPILVRSSPRQPIHPVARLRQAKGRWYTTHSTTTARRFASTAGQPGAKYSRASFPSSATARAVGGLTTRAPFASTLRPNLTGGALPRTAGGYGLGGRTGARYFSHSPAAPAQVVNNVSVAVRAFLLSGQKAQFDGTTALGEKRYRATTSLQEETGRKMRAMGSKSIPGSFIDFHVSPTITALTPLSGAIPSGNAVEMSSPHLNTEGFLDVLSVDFARSLQDFAATMNDLKRLAPLGDLPISLEQKSIIRVRFPGCGAETVEALCDEFGVQRGVIGQDEDFDKSVGGDIALMFPFASTSEHTLSSPGGSLRSQTGHDFEQIDEDVLDNPWLESYESMEEDSSDRESAYFSKPSKNQNSSSFEGVEGIYRFLEQCDNPPRFQ